MNPHFRSILLTAAFFAGLAAGPAIAREPHGETTKSASAADDVTTGSVSGPVETRQQKLNDCMAIWDSGTHMTKKQWRRTCVNQLDEEPNL